jgi:hypothetical protein
MAITGVFFEINQSHINLINYRFEEWATNCNRQDLLTRQNRIQYAHNNCQLCELHFVDDMFQEGSKRLKKTAFPTIFGDECRKNIKRDFKFDVSILQC